MKNLILSAAFISMSGVTPLLETLKELAHRKIPGQILSTDYLLFSEPDALDKLASFENLEVRLFQADHEEGFHTKGYLFVKGQLRRIIVGSSNLTGPALTRSHEWNVRTVSTDQGAYSQQVMQAFEKLWNHPRTALYDSIREAYRIKYETVQKQRDIALHNQKPDVKALLLQPNSMQIAFIEELRRLQEKKETRALLISATGTGKTYAAAFAMRELGCRRVLFLVHREIIARRTMESFQRVLGDRVSYGLVSGTSHQKEAAQANYVFATVQTMARPEHYQKYPPDAFDAIIIDETHRAGAASYQRIMHYFQPGFWLGMSATPERNDDFDIYEAFDHNIACEIRLQQALELDLLCPFHYFGITDLEIDGASFDETTGVRNFPALISDERIRHILEQSRFYGHCSGRLKGLMFVSSVKEAEVLSEKLNAQGLRTTWLSGSHS